LKLFLRQDWFRARDLPLFDEIVIEEIFKLLGCLEFKLLHSVF